jgi:hypothetical protein
MQMQGCSTLLMALLLLWACGAGEGVSPGIGSSLCPVVVVSSGAFVVKVESKTAPAEYK